MDKDQTETIPKGTDPKNTSPHRETDNMRDTILILRGMSQSPLVGVAMAYVRNAIQSVKKISRRGWVTAAAIVVALYLIGEAGCSDSKSPESVLGSLTKALSTAKTDSERK